MIGVGHFTRPILDQANALSTAVQRSTFSAQCLPMDEMLCVLGSLRCSNGCFSLLMYYLKAPMLIQESNASRLLSPKCLFWDTYAKRRTLDKECPFLHFPGLQNSVSAGTTHLWSPMIGNTSLRCRRLSETNWTSSCPRKKYPHTVASLMCSKVPRGERWVFRSTPQTTLTCCPPFRVSTVLIPSSEGTNCVDPETHVTPLVRKPSSWFHQGHPCCLTRLHRAIDTGAAATHLPPLAGAVGG